MIETGVIHGRFQVLHNDHMKYLLAGKEKCRHLVVGITNPDPTHTKDDSADMARSTPEANPLNYFERYTMIRAALLESGLNLSDFSIVLKQITPGHARGLSIRDFLIAVRSGGDSGRSDV